MRKSTERGVELRSSEQRNPEVRRSEHRSTEKRSSVDKRFSGLDKRDRCDPEVISDYEKQVRSLKDEIAALTAEKSALQGRCDTFSQLFSLKCLVVVKQQGNCDCG